MRVSQAIACTLVGLTLAALTGSANAQPVTFQVDLVYEKIVDGPRPRQTVRLTVPAPSAHIAETLCAGSLLKMSRNALANGDTPGLTGNWMAGGGRCVTDKDGNLELPAKATAGEGN